MNYLYLIPLVLVFLSLRSRWLQWKIEDHVIKSTWYAVRNDLTPEQTDDLAKLWPLSHCVWEFWRWDFSRYIMDHDQLVEMNKFIDGELKRSDLTLADFDIKTKTDTES